MFTYSICLMDTVKWQNNTHISKNILMKKLAFCKHFIILQMKHSNESIADHLSLKNQDIEK